MTSQLDWYVQDEPGARRSTNGPPGTKVRLLCAGDLHIGRRSTRLPEHVEQAGLSAAECWRAIVDEAIAREVDAVLLSGDVVDRANRYFEAFGPLEAGLRRLAEAGIRTYAVAGNHDFDVLPRLADSLGPDALRLLGRGGRWERVTLEVGGRRALHVDGWSFPSEHVRSDPLSVYRPAEPDDLPVIGLLHADLDVPASRYAPVSAAALRGRRVDLWVLGHVHQPWLSERPGAASLLYLGSAQALDPGEPGAHGAWLVEVDRAGVTCTQLPLSSVRYDTIDIRLAADGAGDVESLIVERVREALETACRDAGRLAHLSLRLRVTGHARDGHALQERLAPLVRDLQPTRGSATAYVERVAIETRPAVDLEALARGSDPPAVLARILLDLERGGADSAALVRAAELRAEAVRTARPYLMLGGSDGDSQRATAPDTAGVLKQQAFVLLDALLAQKEG